MGGYRHHALFERPDPEARVWRYLDFAKLIDLIDRRALFFSRADRMIDPWEGEISDQIEEANTAALLHQLAGIDDGGFRLDPISPDQIRYERRSAREALRRRTFLSCWCISEWESAAMWDLYAGREGRGVAIQSTFARLVAALPSAWSYPIYAGKVRYIDYERDVIPAGNGFLPFLHKRLSFEHEHEMRVLFETPADDAPEFGLNVPVDLPELIDGIYVAPTAPSWFADLVERTIERFGLIAPVTHSDLLTGPIK